MKRIPSLDSLRYILAVLIVVHHIFVNFYMAEGEMGFLLGTYLAVDGFFVISGVLMMHSYMRLAEQGDLNPVDGLRSFALSRLRRLYPEFLFVLVLTVIVRLALHQPAPWKFLLPDLLMLGNFCGVESMVRDAWFISSLFWIGLLLFGLLLLFGRSFYAFAVPLILLLSYFFIINVPRSLSLNSAPMFFGIFSGSVLRTLLGLCAGMVTYRLMAYLDRLNSFFVICLEAVCLIYAIWLIGHGSNGEQCCDFVPVFSVLVAVLCRHREFFLHFLSLKFFEKVTGSSYMLFLSHLLIVENVAMFFKDELLQWPPVTVFFSLTLLSMAASLILVGLCRRAENFCLTRMVPLLLH